MNTALILAGGVGSRMGIDIPKQFIEVNGKPIIIYTLERFQNNDSIDSIVIVCVHDWIDYINRIVKEYNITKVCSIVEGGACGHDSIRNGIFSLKNKCKSDDIVVIHDSVRPILPQKAINEVLNIAHEKGNASSSTICYPPIVYTDDGISGIKDIERGRVMLTASPQAYRYDKVLELYESAEMMNKHDFTFTSSMYIYFGERVFFAKGTTSNIKITTKADIGLFRALLTISEEDLYD
ncbi:MAG: IspD/TarI family cytidylyltransferase [Candidatus Omnitrophica bacterium]|nr:IspD/TarI family cytidylyltransferase [Candidatus Omnitrophota bacterium]